MSNKIKVIKNKLENLTNSKVTLTEAFDESDFIMNGKTMGDNSNEKLIKKGDLSGELREDNFFNPKKVNKKLDTVRNNIEHFRDIIFESLNDEDNDHGFQDFVDFIFEIATETKVNLVQQDGPLTKEELQILKEETIKAFEGYFDDNARTYINYQ